jgi:hypothetical protein
LLKYEVPDTGPVLVLFCLNDLENEVAALKPVDTGD